MRQKFSTCAVVLLCLLSATLVWGQVAPTLPQPAPSTPEIQVAAPPPAALTHEQSMLLDWPNLARYREANLKLNSPGAQENRVVFMGDSITDAWSLADAFAGKPYINRGISGQTTPHMLVRFRPDVIDLKPKVVVILAGTNDIAGNTGPMTLEAIEENFASMAELARANHIRVILASVLPVFDYPWRPGLEPAQKIIALNLWLKNYAAANHHTYLDYFTPLANEKNGMKAEFSEDGVHPNKAGYAVMQPLAERAIALSLQTALQ